MAPLRDALAPGSIIVISHVANLPDDPRHAGREDATCQAANVCQELGAPVTLRTPTQIADLFTGLDLVDPSLVAVHQWRPGREHPGPPVPVLVGIGEVPETRKTS